MWYTLPMWKFLIKSVKLSKLFINLLFFIYIYNLSEEHFCNVWLKFLIENYYRKLIFYKIENSEYLKTVQMKSWDNWQYGIA